MILIDANVLLYSRDSLSPRHEVARIWLELTLSSAEDVRVGLVSLLAFVRISTHPRVFSTPLEVAAALETIEEWLALPNFRVAEPTERHWAILAEVAVKGQARGPLVSDAHLAALAIEHGARLATTDRGFARYQGLRWFDPLQESPAA